VRLEGFGFSKEEPHELPQLAYFIENKLACMVISRCCRWRLLGRCQFALSISQTFLDN
jgi:hypothetical protein